MRNSNKLANEGDDVGDDNYVEQINSDTKTEEKREAENDDKTKNNNEYRSTVELKDTKTNADKDNDNGAIIDDKSVRNGDDINNATNNSANRSENKSFTYNKKINGESNTTIEDSRIKKNATSLDDKNTDSTQKSESALLNENTNGQKISDDPTTVARKILNKYGGMYIETVNDAEALNEKADDAELKKRAVGEKDSSSGGSADIGASDGDIEILGMTLKQSNFKSESTVNDIEVLMTNSDPTSVVLNSRLLEGMYPVTGNYIRGYESTKTAAVKPEANRIERLNHMMEEARVLNNSLAVDSPASLDGRRASTRRKDIATTTEFTNTNTPTIDSHLAVKEEGTLDPSQLTTTSGKSGKLSRGWSTRMMRTLSNRYRREESDSEEENGDNCIFGTQVDLLVLIRFTIMIISTLCLSSILSNILTFNFTFICMAGPRPENFSNMTIKEVEKSEYRPDLDYDSIHRSALFMAVAVGALLAVFPMTILLNKFGSRTVFGVLGFISAMSTYLIPLSANIGFSAMLIMRVIQGVGFSACLPVMGSITSHWSTLKQNGIFIAILSSFLQIAPIFTMPISGELCMSDYGWESVYYLHGTVCIIIFTIFIFYHRNSPNKHPLMMRKELGKVMFGKGSIYGGPGRQKKSRKVPYRALYNDHAIWAIFVAAFGNFMGTQLSLQFMPTYINKVLMLPISQTGMASAISPIVMFFIKLLAGQSSDKITFIPDMWKLRIYNSLSLGLMGIFFIALGLLNPVEQKSLCLVVLIISTCILGFNSGGFFKSSQMVSRQHSHFTLANISFINCVCMLLVPLLNELIAPENTPETWMIVLFIHGIILLVTNGFFCFMCSSKPAPWTLDTWNNAGREERARRRKSSRVTPQRQSEIRRVVQN